MAKRTIYIHIGCHKTGTTSIQHNLAQNADALKAMGLTFFYENRRSGELQAPELHSWLEFVESGAVVPHGFRLSDPERLCERLAKTEGDVVISSENFSFFFEKERIDELRRSLAPVFDRMQVICYVRRQDRHVISHHQEGSKLFRAAEYGLFGHSTRAIPPFEERHLLYLDYFRRLSLWADVFGDENLTVKVYDRKLLRDGDVVADFFEVLGLEGYRKVSDRNVSLGLKDIKVGHLINGSSLKSKQALAAALKVGKGGGRKMLPARSEARAYFARFAESNARLNQRFRISPGKALFDEDFSDYPEGPEDLWGEEEANAVIQQLLSLSEIHRTDAMVDELRDVAIAIGESRPALAVRLLKLALELRPEGPVIRRKLAEFMERAKTAEATPAISAQASGR